MAHTDLAGVIQHTEVAPTADEARIDAMLDACRQYQFNGAMVQPCWVPRASEQLADTSVAVCTAVGYPMGGDRPETKVTAVRDAVAAGADEVDVMANIGYLKSGRDEAFQAELDALVAAAGDATLKLMLEVDGLTDAELRREIDHAVTAGVDYVKNSSGFGAGGQATTETIRLLDEQTPADVKIKASGGIKTATQAKDLLAAGADLLGASSGVAIVTGSEGGDGY